MLDAGLWDQRGRISFPVKWFGENSCHWGMGGGVTGAFPVQCGTCEMGGVKCPQWLLTAVVLGVEPLAVS